MQQRKLLQLPLEKIRTDGGTQARCELDLEMAEELAEVLTAGRDLPPALVFCDGASYWLADGFHRHKAHEIAGHRYMLVEVVLGSQRDAILYAVGANATHGLRRTNADKRRAVTILLTDPEWRGWSNVEIARRCGVADSTVGRIRDELASALLRIAPAGRVDAAKGISAPEPRPRAPQKYAEDEWLEELRAVLETARSLAVEGGTAADRVLSAIDVALAETQTLGG